MKNDTKKLRAAQNHTTPKREQLEIINTCAPLRQGENGEFFFIADKLYHISRVLSIVFENIFLDFLFFFRFFTFP
jgi:hypothetical protein